MSEYQYYEFQAVDRELKANELRALRRLSSRADITPTSFTNTYDFGDFRGDPKAVLSKYFDGFVYVANWGTHELMLRLPRKRMDLKACSSYLVGESAALSLKGQYVLLEFRSNEDGGDWESGEGWLSSLLQLRQDILEGDFRSLYLGWLLCAQNDELDGDQVEPLPPAGLASISPALKSLRDFLRIDRKLLRAASVETKDATDLHGPRDKKKAWIEALPLEEKNRLLWRMMEGKEAPVRAQVLKQFKKAQLASSGKGGDRRVVARRTVAELLLAAKNSSRERRSGKVPLN